MLSQNFLIEGTNTFYVKTKVTRVVIKRTAKIQRRNYFQSINPINYQNENDKKVI